MTDQPTQPETDDFAYSVADNSTMPTMSTLEPDYEAYGEATEELRTYVRNSVVQVAIMLTHDGDGQLGPITIVKSVLPDKKTRWAVLRMLEEAHKGLSQDTEGARRAWSDDDQSVPRAETAHTQEETHD